MSISTSPVYYAEIYSGSTLKYVVDDILSIKMTKPVTTSIGGFEVVAAHGGTTGGGQSGLSRYKDVQSFYDVWIWLGANNTGSSPIFIGKIDSIQTIYDSRQGYIAKFIGEIKESHYLGILLIKIISDIIEDGFLEAGVP